MSEQPSVDFKNDKLPSELKKYVQDYIGVDEEGFNKLSNEEVLNRVQTKLKEKMKDNPNEMKTLLYPNKLLREICKDVPVFNEAFKTFARHLMIHCRRSKGMGMAAPQVGFLYRIVVVDVDLLDGHFKKDYDKNGYPDTLFNPVITNGTGKVRYKEGCLSLPGIYAWVDRYESFDLSYQDEEGNKKELKVTCGQDSPYGIVLQHEVDHLDGIEFIDKLNFFEKDKIASKLNKFRK